jgi:transcriptional regulator with XRE-family HTH domain
MRPNQPADQKKQPARDPEALRRFGRRLRSIRVQRELTQAELGRRLGVPRATIGRYERGLSAPNMIGLLGLRQELHVPLDFLVAGVRPAPFKDTRIQRSLENLERLSEADLHQFLRMADGFLARALAGERPPEPPASR